MIETICVCGAGTMGSGIAQAAAQNEFPTVLYDIKEEMLLRARLDIDKALQTLTEKNKIGPTEKERILGRIHFTNSIHHCSADLIIEAIREVEEEKLQLFQELTRINPIDTILATNTSSLSVNSMAVKIDHPQRFAGMHFFNPAPVMKLVEIVKTTYVNEHTLSMLTQTAARMGKQSVVCQDAPGFIVNHVARPYYLEALYLLEQGIGDPASIDRLMEASEFKMGPFKLMDLIGNDINYAVSSSIYEAMDRPVRLKPSVLQQQKVRNGELGRKTGKGYFTYER